MEFRYNVRKLLKDDQYPVKEIDDLFARLDADSSGEMDLTEMKDALRALADATGKHQKEQRAMQARADELRLQAADTLAVAEVTRIAEEAEMDLERRAGGSVAVGARLGALLNKKGARAHNVITSWCLSSGVVDKSVFAAETAALGLNASRVDTDALFDTLDTDGGGVHPTHTRAQTLRACAACAPVRLASRESPSPSPLPLAASLVAKASLGSHIPAPCCLHEGHQWTVMPLFASAMTSQVHSMRANWWRP